MIEQRDIQIMAQGACASAMDYLVQVLGIVEGEPVPPETHQALIVASIQTIAFLEVTLRKNLANPESWCAARQTIESLVEEISKKVLDKKSRPGIIRS